MHDDRGARRLALPLLAGVLVTAVVGAVMLASSTPWLLAADTGNGFIGQTVPAYRAWTSGRIPEWTDLLWGGYPIVGDCSNAALYPPHLLAYLVTRSAPLRFFDAAFALHAGILAAGSAYLLAVLGAGRRAQWLAAALRRDGPVHPLLRDDLLPRLRRAGPGGRGRSRRPSGCRVHGRRGSAARWSSAGSRSPRRCTRGCRAGDVRRARRRRVLITRRAGLPIGARAVRWRSSASAWWRSPRRSSFPPSPTCR